MAAFTAYTATLPPKNLTDAIVVPGSGIAVGNVTYTGAPSATSFYDGSLSPLKIGAGILITSGTGTPATTNTSTSFSVSQNTPGDPTLTALAKAAFPGAGATFDAAKLTFSFTVTDPLVKSVSLDLVFGSEEYPEFSSSSYVDIAVVLVNGTNIAYFNNNPSQPLSVINANLAAGNFIANNATTRLPIQYDGVSSALTIVAPVVAGMNTITIAVADTGDRVLDSGLFVSGLKGIPVTATGLLVTLPGTDGSDIITGTDMNQFIDGGGGDDTITLGLGNNVVLAGPGNDIIFSPGSTAHNVINGGAGFDTVVYQQNIGVLPIVLLPSGEIKVGGDSDLLTAVELLQFKDDDLSIAQLLAPDAALHLRGGNRNDTLNGKNGNDELQGGNGDDSLAGQAGNDVLDGGNGKDRLDGGSGNDLLFGGNGDDRLLGMGGADELRGENGNDTLDGGAGNDKLYGDNGNDDLSGGAGNDKLDGGNGNDKLEGGAGDDTLIGDNGDDRLRGGDGNDTISGGNGDDVLEGGGGNDVLAGGKGEDRITGGAGADLFVVGKGGGRDVFVDFTVGVDHLKLEDGVTIGKISVSHGHTFVDLGHGGGLLELLGVTGISNASVLT